VVTYWDHSFSNQKSDAAGAPFSIDDAVANVRRLVVDSVRIRLRSDVPFAVNLSGGIDSAAVAGIASAAMQERDPNARLNVFTLAFPGPLLKRSIPTFPNSFLQIAPMWMRPLWPAAWRRASALSCTWSNPPSRTWWTPSSPPFGTARRPSCIFTAQAKSYCLRRSGTRASRQGTPFDHVLVADLSLRSFFREKARTSSSEATTICYLTICASQIRIQKKY
jgi:hypothetical protein